jgi:YD repeat-containing protein
MDVCEARDVEALGAASHHTRACARDDALWHRLFERDLAHLYASLAPTSHAGPPETLDDDDYAWPDHVLRVSGLAGPDPTGVPRPRLVSHGRPVPVPIAYALAGGQDWRWAYIAHARRITGTINRMHAPCNTVITSVSADRPLGLAAVPRIDLLLEGGRILWWSTMGSVPSSDLRPHSPGTQKSRGNRDLGQEVSYWCACREGETFFEARACESGVASWRAPCFEYLPLEGVRRWYAPTPDGGCVLVAQSTAHKGVTQTFAPRSAPTWASCADRACVERLTSPACAEAVFECSAPGSDSSIFSWERHGDALVRLHNGDSAHFIYAKGAPKAVARFRCSPACPDARFAGRDFANCASWQVGRHSPSEEILCWPTEASDDARAFWNYVAAGHIGWSDEARRYVLQRIPPELESLQRRAESERRGGAVS